MYARTNLAFTLEVLRTVKIRKYKIVANLAVVSLIVSYGFLKNANPEWVIGAVAFVQSVNISEVIEAYLEVKYNRQANPERQVLEDGQDPPKPKP